MKSLINWSEVSRRLLRGDRSRILEHYSRGCKYLQTDIELIKEKQKEIDEIIENSLSKKIDKAIEETPFIETLKDVIES